MLDNVFGVFASKDKRLSGSVDRREFDPEAPVGWPMVTSPEERKRLEAFVLSSTPKVHQYETADGKTGIVYFDERGRAARGKISEMSDDELVRLARVGGKRMPGDRNSDAPRTSKADHGYPRPVQEAGEGSLARTEPGRALDSIRGALRRLVAIAKRADDKEAERLNRQIGDGLATLQHHVALAMSGKYPKTEEEIAEAQRVDPALAFPDEDKQTKQGAFKVSSAVLAILKREGVITSPGDALFRRVRKIIDLIPYDNLPKLVGEKDIVDAQDRIAGRTRDAFHRWLARLKTYAPKLHKHLQVAPENASLAFYVYMRRVSGDELSDILFKRYFQTVSGHPGELRRKDIQRELEKSSLTAAVFSAPKEA